MNGKLYWLILALIFVSLVAEACATPPTANAAPTDTPAATSTSLPAPPNTPEATATITSTPPGGFPVGVYKPEQKLDADRLSFHADGTYLITIGARGIPGTYTVNGDRIVLNEESGVCLNHPGTYSWEAQGNVLTLKAIDETCTGSERGKDLSRVWDLLP